MENLPYATIGCLCRKASFQTGMRRVRRRPQHATPSPGDKAFFGHKRGWGWDRPKDDDGDVDLRTLDWRRGAAVTP